MKRNKINRYLDVLNADIIPNGYKIRFLKQNFALSDLRVYYVLNSDWCGKIIGIEGEYLRISWEYSWGYAPETGFFLPNELRFAYERC